MSVAAFGYVGLRSDKLDDWAEYAPKFLGLQLVERTQSALKFRMDDRKQRIVVSSDAAIQNVFGWEGRRRADPCGAAQLRGVHAGIAFADPAGTRLEALHGPRT